MRSSKIGLALVGVLAAIPGIACGGGGSKNSTSSTQQPVSHNNPPPPPSRSLQAVYVDAGAARLLHYDDSTGATETLATIGAGEAISSCAIAYDASNALHVAYALATVSGTSTTYAIEVTSMTPSGWSIPRQVAVAGANASYANVGIAVDPQGHEHVVFDESDTAGGTPQATFIRHYDAGKGAVEQIAQGLSGAATSQPVSVAVASPSIAADAGGTLHVAFLMTTTYYLNGTAGTCAVQLFAGGFGSWTLSSSAQQAIPAASFSTLYSTTSSADYGSTSIVCDPSGQAEVVFGESDYAGPLGAVPPVLTRYDHYSDAGALVEDVYDPPASAAIVSLPSIAIDTTNLFHAAWVEASAAVPAVYTIKTGTGTTLSWSPSSLRTLVTAAGAIPASAIAD
jgi:hypothetical protein